MLQLLIEAIIVGIVTVVVGTGVAYVVGKFNKIDLPSVCKKWNKNHVMEISLFFTGVVVHFLCEILKVNKWYCTNGFACKA